MKQGDCLNYIELPTTNMETSKLFFSRVFHWTFEDSESRYATFRGPGIRGGIYLTSLPFVWKQGAPLVILYHENLNEACQSIKEAGGTIKGEAQAFPGGHRFRFLDPCGNEFGVWSPQWRAEKSET